MNGLSKLSDAELEARLQQAISKGADSDQAPGTRNITDLTDDQLNQQLGESRPTIEKRTQDTFNLDPDVARRSNILPVVEMKDGSAEFGFPQVAADAFKTISTPGHILEGGDWSNRDAMMMALDVVPFKGMKAPSRTGLTGPTPVKGESKQKFIDTAPQTEELSDLSRAKYKLVDDSGAKLTEDSFLDFATRAENLSEVEGIYGPLHPKLSSVMSSISNQVGKELDVTRLQQIRRHIGLAKAGDANPDERRIAIKLIDEFDEFVDGLDVKDLVGGTTEGVAKNFREARKLWAKSKKSETVEDILWNAENTASGFENGVRIEARKILKDKKKLRNFSEDEVKQLQLIRDGTTTAQIARFFGGFGFGARGSNSRLGGLAGAGFGGAVAGTAGAVAVPVAAKVSQGFAAKLADNQVQKLRAMAATGQPGPRKAVRSAGTPLNVTARAVPPILGTQIPEQDDLQSMYGVLTNPSEEPSKSMIESLSPSGKKKLLRFLETGA